MGKDKEKKQNNQQLNRNIIEELSELLKKHDLNEIEYEKDDDFKVKITKYHKIPAASTGVVAPTITSTQPSETKNEETESKEVDYTNHTGAVKSPMVGSFYASPDPSSPDFVEEGSEVKKGDTLCLIEAMKTFNPIKAHKDGKISKIFKKDKETVEFDEILMVIE
jgi:acetyl-CoA carboxylase biotin carboxyl carrier protein